MPKSAGSTGATTDPRGVPSGPTSPNPDEITGPLPLSPISETVQQVIVAGAGIFPDEC